MWLDSIAANIMWSLQSISHIHGNNKVIILSLSTDRPQRYASDDIDPAAWFSNVTVIDERV